MCHCQNQSVTPIEWLNIMKNRNRLVLLSCLFCAGTSANELYDVSTADGLWVGFGNGISFIEEKSTLHDLQYNDSGFSSKLEIGYDFNSNFGLYGSYDYFDDTAHEHYFHVGGIGVRTRGYLTENLSLFAKAGVNYLLNSNQESNPFGSIGFGVEYNLTNATSIKLGADYYNEMDIDSSTVGNASQVYLGFNYRFGQPHTPIIIEKTEIKEIIKEVEKIVECDDQNDYFISSSFSNGSHVLTDTEQFFEVLLALQENAKLGLSLTGYTDNTGSNSYNISLSKRRAEFVADYFVRNGIDIKRISIVSAGSDNPAVSNDTELGRIKNRRVEARILECDDFSSCF